MRTFVTLIVLATLFGCEAGVGTVPNGTYEDFTVSSGNDASDAGTASGSNDGQDSTTDGNDSNSGSNGNNNDAGSDTGDTGDTDDAGSDTDDAGSDTGDTGDSGDTGDTGAEEELVDNDGDMVLNSIDCDDDNPEIHPYATEVCDDLVDNDCDGDIDDDDADCAVDPVVDADADGVASDLDCDDNDASVHPYATEVCDDLVDNDCDGDIDDDDSDCSSPAVDADGDGFDTDSDCDDADASINTDAVEDCADLVDNDCDGDIDDDDADCAVAIPDDLGEGLDWIGVDSSSICFSYTDLFGGSGAVTDEIVVTGYGVDPSWGYNVSNLTTYDAATDLLCHDFADGTYRFTLMSSDSDWASYGAFCGGVDSSVLCHVNSGSQGSGYSLCAEVTGGVVSATNCTGL